MKKKILFITNTFPSNDRPNAGLFNYRAINGLKKKNYISVLHLRSWKPFRKFFEISRVEDVTIYILSLPILPTNNELIWALQLFFYKRLSWFLIKSRMHEFSIIHSVGASFSGIVGSYFSRKTNLRHIAQCIGSDVNINLMKNYNHIGIKGWERNVNCFTCNSDALKQNINYLYPNHSTKVIYRGVNLNEFQTNTDKTFDNCLNFLFIGGLSNRSETGYGRNYKGGETLLNAWKIFIENSNNPSKNKLYFGGPEVTKETLNESISKYDLNFLNIEIIGELSKQKVIDYMSKAHVVIIPSFMEGFPNVAFEAMASSCAIIASNVGGIPEIIKNNLNGILIEPGNVMSLSQAINSFANNYYQSIEMGQLNRKLIEEKYSSEKFVEKYTKLYEQSC